MSYLYQALSQRVDAWRAANYLCEDFPAIREILESALEDGESGELRYLRRAQLRALETCWYPRLVSGTPRIPDLNGTLFPSNEDRRESSHACHATARPTAMHLCRRGAKGCWQWPALH